MNLHLKWLEHILEHHDKAPLQARIELINQMKLTSHSRTIVTICTSNWHCPSSFPPRWPSPPARCRRSSPPARRQCEPSAEDSDKMLMCAGNACPVPPLFLSLESLTLNFRVDGVRNWQEVGKRHHLLQRSHLRHPLKACDDGVERHHHWYRQGHSC